MTAVVVVRPFETGMDTVHASDCRDLEKDARLSDLRLEFASLAEAKADWDADEELIEMGWTWDTVTVKPCAHK
jgi:hypothetical protein